jgi:uncharacterized membrane protein YcaP (DUF421 family)
MYPLLNSILGLDLSSNYLTFTHLIFRAFIVYFAGMFLVRLQSQFMGINTTFNYMLNFITGSLLANAIVGEGPYFPILGMCLLVIFMNWLIALLCSYSSFMERIIKGKPDILIKNGKIIWRNMRKNLISHDELLEAVHKNLQGTDLSLVKEAYFENSGQITIITHK